MDYFLSLCDVTLEALLKTSSSNVDVMLNLVYEKLSDIFSSLVVIPSSLRWWSLGCYVIFPFFFSLFLQPSAASTRIDQRMEYTQVKH